MRMKIEVVSSTAMLKEEDPKKEGREHRTIVGKM
jgi:hypothetical protein